MLLGFRLQINWTCINIHKWKIHANQHLNNNKLQMQWASHGGRVSKVSKDQIQERSDDFSTFPVLKPDPNKNTLIFINENISYLSTYIRNNLKFKLLTENLTQIYTAGTTHQTLLAKIHSLNLPVYAIITILFHKHKHHLLNYHTFPSEVLPFRKMVTLGRGFPAILAEWRRWQSADLTKLCDQF